MASAAKQACGVTALHSAAEKNKLSKIKRLLSRGVDVNAKDKLGRTPLHMAAFYNESNSHFQSIDLLLQNRADANAQDDEKNTPLHNLIEKAKIEIVKLLLKFEADVSIRDVYSRDPLFGAIQGGNFKVVELLVNHGSDVKKADKYGLTPLVTAAIYNKGESHFEIIELLLKNGADVNEQDKSGKTVLHDLVGQANVKTVELFLKFKADVNIKNNDGEIPLFNAIRAKNEEVVQLLLDCGSNVNNFNNSGMTVLHFACESTCSVEVIKRLLKKGLDANSLDKYGYTPFMLFLIWSSYRASYYPDIASLTHLLKYADINVVNSRGENILCIESREIILKLILEHIAKLEALNIALHPSVLESISKKKELKNYFEMCKKELAEAKSTKLRNCWITFFNFLVGSKKKLKNYAGNPDLVEDFEKGDSKLKFPIYKSSMEKNVAKGMQVRKFFDDSADILSNRIPIFNPTHLIIRDILDCLKGKELLKLCEN